MNQYLNFQQVIGTATDIWRSDFLHYEPLSTLLDYWLKPNQKKEIGKKKKKEFVFRTFVDNRIGIRGQF